MKQLTKVFSIDLNGSVEFYGSLAGLCDKHPSEEIGIAYKALSNYFSKVEGDAWCEDPLRSITQTFTYENKVKKKDKDGVVKVVNEVKIYKGVLLPKFQKGTDVVGFLNALVEERMSKSDNPNDKRRLNLKLRRKAE